QVDHGVEDEGEALERRRGDVERPPTTARPKEELAREVDEAPVDEVGAEVEQQAAIGAVGHHGRQVVRDVGASLVAHAPGETELCGDATDDRVAQLQVVRVDDQIDVVAEIERPARVVAEDEIADAPGIIGGEEGLEESPGQGAAPFEGASDVSCDDGSTDGCHSTLLMLSTTAWRFASSHEGERTSQLSRRRWR